LVAAAGAALGLGKIGTSRGRRAFLLAGAAALAIAAAAAVIATSLAHGGRKSATLFAAPNTLARIDPTTKKVDAVVNVGLNPVVSAGSGQRVWVYSEESGKISEIDTRTNRVIERTLVSLLPPAECCGLYWGRCWPLMHPAHGSSKEDSSAGRTRAPSRRAA
jgi:hypothetical protein